MEEEEWRRKNERRKIKRKTELRARGNAAEDEN